MNSTLEKRLLQAAVALAACVPVTAGLAGVLHGAPAQAAGFDSHFRYLSGLLLAIGLTFWSLIPGIERRGSVIRRLTFLVVLGGCARLYSVVVRGDPGAMHWALAMELGVTPALCLLQAHVASRLRAPPVAVVSATVGDTASHTLIRWS